MSTLLVARHGQASFSAENYDVLSSLGIRQSCRLGVWLARMAVHLDAIWSGPLQRQIDTARHLVHAAADVGHRLPDPKILDDLRELPASQLLQHVVPQLDKRSFDRRLWTASTAPAVDAAFETIEAALNAWAHGQVDVGEIESFESFETRIRRAFQHIIERTAVDQCAAVVTSAGPMAIAMRLALNLDRISTMRLGSITANSGVTTLRYRHQRFELVAFNSVGHLERDEVTRI